MGTGTERKRIGARLLRGTYRTGLGSFRMKVRRRTCVKGVRENHVEGYG